VTLNEVYVNTNGNYTGLFKIDSDLRYQQTYIQLTPIVLRKTDNHFDLGVDYTSEILISPLTKTVRRNVSSTITNQTTNSTTFSAIQIVFGNTEIQIYLFPETVWAALKDVGGMVSLMLFFAAFAGCKHITQFNDSLKKGYYRASRAFAK
jgi:hypothetical protein